MFKAAKPAITTIAITMAMAWTQIAVQPVQAEIAWESGLRAAHKRAAAESKLLLLHFYSDNCIYCEKLEKGSFLAPQVGQAITQNFVPVKIHANTNPEVTKMFKVTRFPTDIVVTTEGKLLSHEISPQDPDKYVNMLVRAIPKTPPSGKVAAVAKASAEAEIKSPPKSDPTPQYARAAAPAATPKQSMPAPTAINLPKMPQAQASSVKTNELATQPAGFRNNDLTLSMPQVDSVDAAPPVNQLQMPPTPEASMKAPAIPKPPIAAKPAAAPPSDETPELAMEGFCAVTVVNDNVWVEGKPEFGVIHLGKLYLFDSRDKMDLFLADPVPFTPILNEIDVVRFFEEQRIVPGKREWGMKDPVYQRMFFFADKEAMEHFEDQYHRYIDAAVEVMEKAVRDANPGM